MVDESAGAHEETVELAVLVDSLDAVKQTADHVVTAGSLSARKNHTYIDGLVGCGGCSLLKHEFGKTVGIGKQFLNLFLIAGRLGGLALLNLHSTGKDNGELRTISRAGYLQRTFLHYLRY